MSCFSSPPKTNHLYCPPRWPCWSWPLYATVSQTTRDISKIARPLARQRSLHNICDASGRKDGKTTPVIILSCGYMHLLRYQEWNTEALTSIPNLTSAETWPTKQQQYQLQKEKSMFCTRMMWSSWGHDSFNPALNDVHGRWLYLSALNCCQRSFVALMQLIFIKQLCLCLHTVSELCCLLTVAAVQGGISGSAAAFEGV